MLALPTMHDVNLLGGPMVLNNSPPHLHMHASQGLMNQTNLANPSRLDPRIHQQNQYPLQTSCHGRYPQHSMQHSQSHPMQLGAADYQQKIARRSFPYATAWGHNNEQNHQDPKQVEIHENVNSTVQNFQNNRQHERESPVKQKSIFSQPISLDSNTHEFDANDYEDVDEDDISDLEEEEELRRSYELYRQQLHRHDVSSKLLVFADVITSELTKYFGRNKDQEDSCDVYEDKWATTKSGRELYYADLLRIAQGDMEPACKTVHKTSSSPSASTSSFNSSSPSSSPKGESDNRSEFKGKRDVSIGMGPLTELFEYGLKNFLTDKRETSLPSTKSKERLRDESSKPLKSSMTVNKNDMTAMVPMHERNLPESFWKEPGTSSVTDSQRFEMAQPGVMLASSRLPDFSDLVESWQGSAEGMNVTHNAQHLNISMDQSKF